MMSNELVEATSSARGTTLLDIRNLSVDYYAASGTVHALDNVSIERLTRITKKKKGSGRSGLNGHAPEPVDILAFTPDELRSFRWSELSIVFQSAMNALNPVLNIGAQIDDVLKRHQPTLGPESRKKRIAELLRLVGIAPDRTRSYPHELSGGMRQRSIIAIALALSPELIIMDEPTTALDVVVQREILTEIMGLRERLNFSVIFITHDISLLRQSAPQTQQQMVACHLYDPRFNNGEELPSNMEFAAKYEAYYEALQGVRSAE